MVPKVLNLRLCLLCLLCLAPGLLQAKGITGESVVVVANERDPASMAIARHYMQARTIPDQNLILLSLKPKTHIQWKHFVSRVYNPIQATLIEKQFLNARLIGEVDPQGRERIEARGHRVDFLVLCRLPTTIRKSPDVASGPKENDSASVDSELSLLPLNDVPTASMVPNPLFGLPNPPKAALAQVIRVSRLDGPSTEAVVDMIDRGLLAEEQGLSGRVLIDLVGPDQTGDDWLNAAADTLAQRHAPVIREPTGRRFTLLDPVHQPAWYLGWYHKEADGPFADPRFRFAPGAIAVHIYSYSAHNLRDPKQWTAALIERGVSFTVGNTGEPYLGLTHRPDVLAMALHAGLTAGESAYAALPSLSWQTLHVGDPLYRPYGQPERPFEAQQNKPTNSVYSSLFAADQQTLSAQAKSERFDAERFLRKQLSQPPEDLPLRAQLGIAYAHQKRPEAMLRLCEPLDEAPAPDVATVGLYVSLARSARGLGLEELAVELFQKALQAPFSPKDREALEAEFE
jgi:uncharacterized protein (TIGR03790 family)